MIYTVLIKLLLITSVFSLYFPKSNIVILHSPIFAFLPNLKLHHSVLIKPIDSDCKNKCMGYIVDFSPVNQTIYTMTKLLFLQSIPAEIRIRHIGSLEKYSSKKDIINHWHSVNSKLTAYESQLLTDKTYENINDEFIKEKMSKIIKWDSHMNLYYHNCQHFSSFVKQTILQQ